MVQWLGLGAFTAGAPGSIPGQETKIPQATQCGKKKKKDSALYPKVSGKPLKNSKSVIDLIKFAFLFLKLINLFIFGCVGSSLLCVSFL